MFFHGKNYLLCKTLHLIFNMLWLEFTVFLEKHKRNRLLLLNPKLPPAPIPRKSSLENYAFFPIVIEQTTKELKPHTLCVYLYELATEFSSFYNQEKVMVDDLKTQHLRLFLCTKTKIIMETGLQILGIQTLEEM